MIMAKILFVNLPYLGHVIPTLGVVEELVKRGHSVDYISTTLCKDRIEAAGATLIPYYKRPNVPLNTDYQICYESYITAKRIIHNYDLFIYEMGQYLCQTLAEECQIPVVRICHFGFSDKVVAKFLKTAKNFWIFKFWIFRKALDMYMGKKNVKIQEKYFYDEIARHYPEINIVHTVESFQLYREDFDERFYFVGPNINHPHRTNDCTIPYDLMNNPIIYISMGTVWPVKALLDKAVEAFKGRNVHVIVSMGQCEQQIDTASLPENFFAYKFVPQIDVLRKASLFITHAGMGSVNESLYFGVPMLMSPVASDQPMVAERVEELNLGKRINLKKITPSELCELAFSVMQNDEIRSNLKKMQQDMHAAGGAVRAADIIEEKALKTIYKG